VGSHEQLRIKNYNTNTSAVTWLPADMPASLQRIDLQDYARLDMPTGTVLRTVKLVTEAYTQIVGDTYTIDAADYDIYGDIYAQNSVLLTDRSYRSLPRPTGNCADNGGSGVWLTRYNLTQMSGDTEQPDDPVLWVDINDNDPATEVCTKVTTNPSLAFSFEHPVTVYTFAVMPSTTPGDSDVDWEYWDGAAWQSIPWETRQ
jgi:hypothetical protein